MREDDLIPGPEIGLFCLPIGFHRDLFSVASGRFQRLVYCLCFGSFLVVLCALSFLLLVLETCYSRLECSIPDVVVTRTVADCLNVVASPVDASVPVRCCGDLMSQL